MSTTTIASKGQITKFWGIMLRLCDHRGNKVSLLPEIGHSAYFAPVSKTFINKRH
jgi:hypothetical protein